MLTLGKHIKQITGETYNLLRNIKATFTHLDEGMIKKLITLMIQPRLEYAALVWSPCLKKDIRKLEKIQRAATKLPESLRGHIYERKIGEIGIRNSGAKERKR